MNTWIMFSVVMTAGKAAGALVNEYFQVRAIHLLFWMRTAVLLALLPLVFVFTPPDDLLFYLILIGASFLVPYADLIYIGLTARSGAGVVTRILPLVVVFMFVTWLPFAPDLVGEYISHPLRTAGILVAIGGSVYFAMRLRHCPVSFPALKAIIPALLLWSLATALGKLALERVEGDSKVFYYLLIQCIVVWFSYILLMMNKRLAATVPHMALESKLFQSRAIIAGVASGVFWLIATACRWLAIDRVENPAYVSVIGLTAPFLVILLYKIIGKQEKAHIASGVGIVLCAALLIYFTKA